jgi:D-tyrosyl-tRNA(Tyr) deacylase
VEAAPPDKAKELYAEFVRVLGGHGIPVETGRFGAKMEVEILNDGPVTLIIER